MCKNICKILYDPTKKNFELIETYITYITTKCECNECIYNYKRTWAVIIIRNFIINNIKRTRINKLKSIGSNYIIFNYKYWMDGYYKRINNLNIALEFIYN